MQIMSFEFFLQKIMTGELQEPREQSRNEDFQVTKSKSGLVYSLSSNFCSFFPLIAGWPLGNEPDRE